MTEKLPHHWEVHTDRCALCGVSAEKIATEGDPGCSFANIKMVCQPIIIKLECECGAAKTGVAFGQVGHSNWCPAAEQAQ